MAALVVRSKVRECCKGMRVSGDFFDALDKAVENLVKAAVKRAKANGRMTLKPADL